MRAHLFALALLPAVVPPLAAQHHHHETEAAHEPAIAELGHVTFPTSGSAEAQPHFLRGLLLLHSFEYQPARRAFQEARAIDPDFAMACWGEAMTHNHPIWGVQDRAAAREVLGLLGETAAERRARAPTERERAYLDAVERLFFGAGDKRARDAAYSEAMGEFAARFPDDLDARAFYALSLLGLAGRTRDTANYLRAAAVAEEVYELEPRHPGALHYLIHAYDDPVHAPLGLRAARRYARVAPAAAHAQHMPSHIFYALGLWEESIASNSDSLSTSRAQGQGGYHALHWLQHARLQLGRRDEAARLVALLEADVEEDPTPFARTHLAMTRATWLVETRGADLETMGRIVDSEDLVTLAPFAALDLARGLAFVEREDLAAARASLAALRARLAAGREAAGSREEDEVASRYAAVLPSEIAAAEIMTGMLEAALAFAEGRPDEALRLARAAAEAEDAVEFEYGPPPTAKPPYELLGELLLRAGRHREAAQAFERALARYPNRTLTLEGLRAISESE